MSYVVLARRYRPQAFEDLIGQEHVTRTLQNALLQSRTAHAYLFTGPRGVGKTSAARILARALRCLNLTKSGDPCNECEACKNSLEGTSLDIIEIDAASNTGVDNIRDLRGNVEYMASVGKYRVYIIDEVHMLSTAAFNALLKTLEEPPPHVVFIFATTELHKVLPTILSRCQRFDFKKISAAVMREKLEEICTKEKISIDEISLKTIITESEGCMRDAESLLDQAMALCGQEITFEKMETMLSLMDRASLLKLAQAFAAHDTGTALKITDQLFSKGIEAKILISKLVDFFSDLHFYAFTGEFRLEDTEINDAQKNLKSQWAIDEIVRALDLCLKVQGQLSSTLNAALTVESMVAKLCLQRPIAMGAQASTQAGTPQYAVHPETAPSPSSASNRLEQGFAPAAHKRSEPNSAYSSERTTGVSAPAPTRTKASASTANSAPGSATPSSINTAPNSAPTAPKRERAPSAQSTPATVDANDGNLRAQFEQFIKAKKPAWVPVLGSVLSLEIENDMVKAVAKSDFAGKRLASNDGIETLKTAFKVQKAVVHLEAPAVSNDPKVDPKEKLIQKHTMAKEHEAVKSAMSIFNATITETKVLDDENPKKGV